MIDFVLIGGGIAGLSAAARLSSLGSVLVLEAEVALGYHASGRSAALFEENYGASSVVALNKASHRYLREAGVLSARGILLIGKPDNAADFAADTTKLAMEPITLAEAKQFLPILDTQVVDRAAYEKHAVDIDTDRLLQGFAATARANGGQIKTRAAATGIEREKTGWTITTKEGTYQARTIVNAAGAWADHVAIMAGIPPLGLQPFRRSMGRIPAPGGHDVSDWPMTFGPGENWYCKPDAGALIISPADEDPMDAHDAFADDMVLAEGIARYEDHVTEPVTRMLSNWAGLRTFAPDRQLVLGPDPADDGFVWSAGQGGYGFSTAAAASQLLADRIAGKPNEIGAKDVAALSPDRFR